MISEPTPVTISIIITLSGSFRSVRPKWYGPAASHVHEVVSWARAPGERESMAAKTTSAPVAKRTTASAMYQETSGPCIDLQDVVVRGAGVVPQHDAADRRHEQHDRGDLEREQVVGQEEPPDLRRRAEAAVDLRRLGE